MNQKILSVWMMIIKMFENETGKENIFEKRLLMRASQGISHKQK